MVRQLGLAIHQAQNLFSWTGKFYKNLPDFRLVPSFHVCHQVVSNFTRFLKSTGVFYHLATLLLNVSIPVERSFHIFYPVTII